MPTAEDLLERVFDLLDYAKAEDIDVVSVQAIYHIVGSRAAFHARELVRDLAAAEVAK